MLVFLIRAHHVQNANNDTSITSHNVCTLSHLMGLFLLCGCM